MIEMTEKKWETVSFLFINIVSFLSLGLRLINLGDNSLWCDDGITALAVKGILQYGWPLLPSGLIYFKQILFSYLAAFFTLIFGFNEFGLRLTSVIAGTLTIPLTYKFARDTFNRPVALVAALFMAFNIWGFEYSRQVRYYSLLQFFYLLSCYLFYRGFIKEEKKIRKWAVVSFLASIFVFRLSLFLVFNYLILIIFKGLKKTLKKEILWGFLLILAVFTGSLFFEVFFWQTGRHVQHVSGLKAIIIELLGQPQNFYRVFQWLFRRMALLVIFGFLAWIFQIILAWRYKDQSPSAAPSLAGWTFTSLNFLLPLAAMFFGRSRFQQRFVFFLLPFFAILYSQSAFWFSHNFTKILLGPAKKNKNSVSEPFQRIIFIILVILTIQAVAPQKILNIVYRRDGDPVNPRYAPTSAAAIKWDHKSTGLFVKKHLRPSDVVIDMYAMIQLFYAGKVDYWLYSINLEGWPNYFERDGRLWDTYSGAEMIRNLETLQKTISQNNSGRRRTWIISTFSIKDSGHIKPDIRDFLEKNRDKIVFQSRDPDAHVWLWPSGAGSL